MVMVMVMINKQILSIFYERKGVLSISSDAEPLSPLFILLLCFSFGEDVVNVFLLLIRSLLS